MSIINEALKKAREEKEKKLKENIKTAVELPSVIPAGSQQTEALQNEIKSDKSNLHARPVLFVVFAAIILAGAGLFILSNTRTPSSQTSLSATADITMPETSKNLSISYPKQNLSDLQDVGDDTSEFILTGIVHGEGSPMAIINGSVYMIGDKIKTARVSHISEDTVVLEKNGTRIELKVK